MSTVGHEPTEHVPDKGPTEKKVTAAAAAAYVIPAMAMYLVNLIVSDSSLLTPLPDAIEPLILALLPGIAGFIGGYSAPHTFRTDKAAFKTRRT